MSKSRIKLGISSCLAGANVRMDGGHMRNAFCMDTLSQFVDFESYCPESAIGLPSPRPSIRLNLIDNEIHAVSAKSGDFTDDLLAYGAEASKKMNHLSGFILSSKSPSCGMERVRVYTKGQFSKKIGVGLFAQQLMKYQPLMPLEEQGRLNDIQIRENFLTRVYVYNAWLNLNNLGLTPSTLLEFHSIHKYLVMAHKPVAYKSLGKLLANLSENFEEKSQQYIVELMGALKDIITRKNHVNVLQHLQGYFKQYLNKEQKQELTKTVELYRQALIPLMVPISLIKHYLLEFPDEYLLKQRYLNPTPIDLALRYKL